MFSSKTETHDPFFAREVERKITSFEDSHYIPSGKSENGINMEFVRKGEVRNLGKYTSIDVFWRGVEERNGSLSVTRFDITPNTGIEGPAVYAEVPEGQFSARDLRKREWSRMSRALPIVVVAGPIIPAIVPALISMAPAWIAISALVGAFFSGAYVIETRTLSKPRTHKDKEDGMEAALD